MNASQRWLGALSLVLATLLAACGGGAGGINAADGLDAAAPRSDREAALSVRRPVPRLDICDAAPSTVLAPVPPVVAPPPSGTVKVHYQRADGDYADWGLHVWQVDAGNAYIADYPNVSWPAPLPRAGIDAYGAFFVIDASLFRSDAAGFGFIVHRPGAAGDPGVDRIWKFGDGDEFWVKSGDATVYRTNPDALASLDLATLRVHYLRFDANFAPWGLHLWDTSRIDAARLPGLTLNVWDSPIPFAAMPNYAAPSANEVVFDLPVLNPKDDVSRSAVEFIVHGTPSNPNGGSGNKDGWSANIRVDYANLAVASGIGEVWLVQETPTVFYRAPDLRQVSTTDARAYWLSERLIQWPRVDTTGRFRLYHSAQGQIVAPLGAAVTGADGALELEVFGGAVPEALATRFKFVGAGAVLSVKRRDVPRLAHALLAAQLVLVQEDGAGRVQNATTAQLPGALDALFAEAAREHDLGAVVHGASTHFKLWAPTAQRVQLCVYDSGSSPASGIETLHFDARTGIWSTREGRRLEGRYYRYAVEVFARGTGLVRNLVTDPYSVGLTTDSTRSYVADLESRALKPPGWDRQRVPALPAQTDMSIYELHVRDFSANDPSVPLADRGKYRAFTWPNSNGMRHLRALAQAGLTDVHLLPVFDIASVPEAGCVTPAIPNDAPDAETQQAAVNAVRDTDCFNWGYDPYHYTVPEGSYASDAADGATRIVEFRQMVMALHAAGLRVGMDVVYNHTSASGQNDRAVLDRVVPGYYHRLDASGNVERSTCCENTATENLMMGKLMIDSVKTWATQYRIDSFRFDLMGHQPRAVMEQLKATVDRAAGRPVPLIGEGWNFGEVADGARFVQASQLSLNGSGIATFSDRARDYVRGGGPFDGGADLVRNQGYINGLFYDDNGSGAGKTKTDLMWAGDIVKVGLAGSIRDYPLTTHWDATLPLQQIDYNGQPAGYVTSPTEVVNYVENHDNQTLFDINAYKLPMATSREDRARAQMLGAAINAFSQGIAYFHAGVDTLRSKSMDRNSYNSGDWFNRLDWRYGDNNFGVGAPPQGDNGDNWFLIKPRLADAAIKPTSTEIAWTRDAFRDLLRIRGSSTLFRLRSAGDVKARLHFYNTGSAQVPTVLAGHLDGNGYPGARFHELLYLVNVDTVAQSLTVEAERGKAWQLHPVHLAPDAADRRAANDAHYDGASGRFTIPPRSAVVWVVH